VRLLVGAVSRLEEEDGPVDFQVEVDTGAVFAGTIATLSQLQKLMDRWATTGECLGGRYLWMDSLIIVSRLADRDVADVMTDLIKTSELERALRRI